MIKHYTLKELKEKCNQAYYRFERTVELYHDGEISYAFARHRLNHYFVLQDELDRHIKNKKEM